MLEDIELELECAFDELCELTEKYDFFYEGDLIPTEAYKRHNELHKKIDYLQKLLEEEKEI